MTRIPRLCRLFALAAVLALTVVPLASARPLEGTAAREADGGFFSAALKWVEDIVEFRRPSPEDRGRRQGLAAIPRKESSSTTNSGSCIDPVGRPRPCFT